ncbi:MAG: hypothetical protein AMS26_24215 [Bacteroides sp. SM23_62]|nr:MAG: hypothetical protein AMS26_24215 [Bacteroides sp. SM23_62]
MAWKDNKISELKVLSKTGNTCRINTSIPMKVKSGGKNIKAKKLKDGTVEFKTTPGDEYILD